MSKFEREERYLVVKYSDMVKFLSDEETRNLIESAKLVDKGRERINKKPLSCVVVENDWPEYETVWKMIEDRINDNH